MKQQAEPPFTESDWERELGAALGYPLRVRYGRSRSSPIQMRTPTTRELARWPELSGGCVLRLHSLFVVTPPEVRRAIASWMRSGRRARHAYARMSEWMHAALAELEPRPPRSVRLEPTGRHHDLDPLGRALFASEFRDDFDAQHPRPALSWGRRARSRARHSLRLGSYEPCSNGVRVHPVLDQPAVPAWFVRYVLFHELLHAAVPVERDRTGRTLHHGPAFKRRELLYPDHQRALRWERDHIDALIRSARSGRPLKGASGSRRSGRNPAPKERATTLQLELFASDPVTSSTRR